MRAPDDLHEWVSFDDPEEARTWVFDVTFLTSSWTCIFGRGCRGVLTEDHSHAQEGCCSYGAHFTGDDDVRHVQAMAEQLTPEQWQFRHIGRAQGITQTDDDGATTTLLHDDACVFLNRPGFDGDGIGCAFHHLAEVTGQRHVDVMPEVCWQLPLRRVDETDDHGHVTSTVREWKRRDWGDGGHDFHWWCTESSDAFVGAQPVYTALEAEMRTMVGDEVYAALVKVLRSKARAHGSEVFLPHPAAKRRKKR